MCESFCHSWVARTSTPRMETKGEVHCIGVMGPDVTKNTLPTYDIALPNKKGSFRVAFRIGNRYRRSSYFFLSFGRGCICPICNNSSFRVDMRLYIKALTKTDQTGPFFQSFFFPWFMLSINVVSKQNVEPFPFWRKGLKKWVNIRREIQFNE